MENDIEILSVGDASWDVFISPSEIEALCQLKDKDCLICFSYGDKIPVKEMDVSVGGNAANNAVGTRRLGVKSAILSTLGDDAVSHQINEKLTSEGVDMRFLTKVPETSSNYSTVINYMGERTIFTYHVKRNYVFPENLPVVPWIYLTSMGEGFENFYEKLSNWVESHSEVKLAFNPGSYQLRAERKVIDGILKNTYLIYVNREEAEKITGFGKSQGKEKELLVELAKTGPKTSVITDGGGGSYAYDGERFYHAGVLPVDAYERTGAGDAFGSGCLSAIVHGKSWNEALLWGTLNSASVIGYVGPQRGLLRESEIPVWLERARSCKLEAKEI